jgi:phosphoribosylamine---glycine ligase
MNVLVVGGGGREHALVWKISKSPYIEKIYCAPGNAGIADLAECVDIPVTDIKGLVQFAEKNAVDLTVVGPELPLSLGLVDALSKRGLTAFGPTKKAAQVEGSKSYAKSLMVRFGIPTAAYHEFTKPDLASAHLLKAAYPCVLKADGLAEGKGVLICAGRKEALDGLDRIMRRKDFGEAGKKLIVEEMLTGEEASVLALTDGEKIVLLPSAQDHKAVFEGDRGPNTGGMGAYSPAPVITPALLQTVRETVFVPMIRGMRTMGIPYRGVLYAGLMITASGPKVLEFNCRFGDPETQAILPLIRTDLVDLLIECAEGRLKNETVEIDGGSSVCVVMASGGYPGTYEKGKVIQGLGSVPPDVRVFHAGTKKKDGSVVTSGGRVLGVTATGETIARAIEKAYQAVGRITFDGAYFRSDIGHRALKRKP